MPRTKTTETTVYPTALTVEARTDALGGKQLIAAITIWEGNDEKPVIYSAFRNGPQMLAALKRYIGPSTKVNISINL